MKIYLDYNIAQPLGFEPCKHLDTWIDQVPHGVDLIGLTFFHHKINKIRTVVDLALSKSRYVIIYFCEFNGSDVVRFEREYHEKYPNLQIFANAVPHYPSRLRHIGEWFMQLQNPYSSESWAQDLLTRLQHNETKPFRFDCLLGRQSPARDFIAEKYHLARSQDFIFTYFKDSPKSGRWDELDDADMTQVGGRGVNYRGNMISASNILPVEIYNQSYYSIVSDTTCPPRFNFYTEKVAKPLVAGRLFVAFSGRLYLSNLRKLGFRTFHGIIDESYDTIFNDAQRFQAAWTQVEFLLQQDPVMIQQQCREIVKHNQSLMLDTDWPAPMRDHIQTIIGQL